MQQRLVVILCLLVLTPTAFSQNPRQATGRRGRPAPQSNTDIEMRVIPLRFANAEMAAAVINSVMDIEIVGDERSNSLIVGGSEEKINQVIELVSELDKQRDKTVLEQEMNVVSIRNREVDEITARLRNLFEDEMLITGDEQGRRVLLRGNADSIQSAINVIKQMDTPLPTASVEFAYFQVGTSDTEFSMETPDDLKPVARQLERFGTPRLVGRMTTSAVEGQNFSLNGQIAERTYLNISGRLLAAANDGAVKLELQSELRMHRAAEGERRGKIESPRFSLSTTVIANRGDFVVLGSAPLGWAPGESVILVVQVPEKK